MTESLQLRIQVPGSPDRLVSVNKSEFIIGRSQDCDLTLTPYGMSRHHLRLFRSRSDGWFLEDLNSKNGTRLNRLPVHAPQSLRHGDRIFVENICLLVVMDGAGRRSGNTYPGGTRRPVPPPTFSNPLESMGRTPASGDRPNAPSAGGQRNEHSGEHTAISLGSGGKMRIARDAQTLRQQWVSVEDRGNTLLNQERTISRLQDLVDIAKRLTSAESIEEIFSQVQAVVFRYLTNIQRLALLVDVQDCHKLQLLNAAARDLGCVPTLVDDNSWISHSICHKVFTEKVALQIADAQSDERFGEEQSILYKGIRSAMAVPLWDEAKVVGVLYADAHLSSERWVQEGEEDLSFFSALANLVAASVQRWILSCKLQQEERLCAKLERYHSPSVVQQMLAAGSIEGDRISPKEAEISILFADLVGFTALSERLSPAEVASLLNGFFEEMLQEIFSRGGTLDKFIGDCIMAFFGAPEPQADHAERAAIAAQQMLRRLSLLNARNTLGETLQLRIAINSGRAVVGDVGSSQRVDYTVLGGAVNLASRMEAICPPGRCIISESTYQLLPNTEGWLKMGEFRFKGIERPVPIYQTLPIVVQHTTDTIATATQTSPVRQRPPLPDSSTDTARRSVR